MPQITGHISQVIGPVVDVYFEGENVDAEQLLPDAQSEGVAYFIHYTVRILVSSYNFVGRKSTTFYRSVRGLPVIFA